MLKIGHFWPFWPKWPSRAILAKMAKNGQKWPFLAIFGQKKKFFFGRAKHGQILPGERAKSTFFTIEVPPAFLAFAKKPTIFKKVAKKIQFLSYLTTKKSRLIGQKSSAD